MFGLEGLTSANAVVGGKQLLRAIQAGEIARVYVATDADLFATRRVVEACRERNLPVVETPSMKALGEACGIQVSAAVAGVRK